MSLWNNPPYYLTAYGLAVKHGFTGTEKQWLDSLKGEPGLDLMVVDTFETYADMIEYYSSTKPDGFVMVGTTTDYLLYYWDAVDQEWYSINLQGRDGETGAAATVVVGTVTTLDPGEDATVTNSGTEHAAVFNFGIPKGAPGDDGVSVTDFTLVSGTHAAGTLDTYSMVLSDGTEIPVYIYNGADGLGAGDMLKSIYDPQNKNRDIFAEIAAAVAASVTSINGETGDVILNHVALADNLYSIDNQEIYDGYVFRTSGGTVSIDNGSAELTTIYGNTEASGRVPEVLTIAGTGNLNLSINSDTWNASALAENDGSYVFTYDTDHWEYGGSTVDLADYGISVNGAPADEDTITVTYAAMIRGTLVNATPTDFKAIGLNQFDKANNILADYSIDTSGNVVANTGTYVAYIHAVGGLDDGYTVYSSNNAVLRIGLCESVPDSGTTGIEIVTSNLGTSYVTPDEDCYICVVCTDIDTLCVHPTWSGYEDATYEAYWEDSIEIPTEDANGTALPTASYGMPSVGTVRDELSFDLKTYTQRITRITYSEANLETVKAMGVEYDYDASTIYYVLGSPIVYSLDSAVSAAYSVADFGTEEFLGTSVKLYAQNVYGQNLRDKLRTDVVTISAQSLTQNQQQQVRKNIGALAEASGADEYDENSGTYAAGDLCIHANKLYKCNTDINSPETWTAAHWDETSIDAELLSIRETRGTLSARIPRWLRFDPNNRKGLIIKAGTQIRKSDGNIKAYSADTQIDLTSQLGTSGADYFLYLNDDDTYTADTTEQNTGVKIGRFHTLCAAAGTMTMIAPASGMAVDDYFMVKSYRQDQDPDFYAFYRKKITAVTTQTYYDKITVEHPLSGFDAGDILPESVWCLSFHPECLYEDAMVYDKDTDRAIDVYLQSGKAHNTRSAYNQTHTTSRQPINHQEDMRAVGKRLLRDCEFTSAALGSNERTSIAGSADATYVGGHSDTASRRMISAIGCEEMCGYIWQWLDELGPVGNNTSGWASNKDGHDSFGQWYGEPYVLLAGGDWSDGAHCGSRSRYASNVRSTVYAGCGGRGSSRVSRNA